MGNKIGPVSKEVIAKVDDGKGVQVVYQGKIYNLCCPMCAKDFKKNPEKFGGIAEKEVAEQEGHTDHEEKSEGGHEHNGSGHPDEHHHDH